MTSSGRDDLRSVALDGYLAHRRAEGFEVETRSTWQAVIVRRHAMYFVLRHARPSIAQRRLVVSVDDVGNVTAVAAEPTRW